MCSRIGRPTMGCLITTKNNGGRTGRSDMTLICAVSVSCPPPCSVPTHDPGSAHVRRFRSIPEFVPHAYWLLTDTALDRGNCECKYCSHIPQRVISERMGLLGTRSSSSTPSQSTAGLSQSISVSDIRPSTTRGTTSRPYRPPPQTAVRKAIHASRTQSSRRLRNYITMDIKPIPEFEQERLDRPNSTSGRLNDVRSAFSSSLLSIPRWFRVGEVVWCKVPDSPIHQVIEYWPGVVENSRIKSVSKDCGDTTDPANRETLQWTVYTVRLLGLQRCFVRVRDSEVLPYQLHSTPQPVWIELGRLIQDQNVFDWNELQQLNPFETNRNLATDPMRERASLDLLKQSAAPFALAASLASKISEHYCPIFQFMQQTPVPPLPSSSDKGKRPSRAKEAVAVEIKLVFGEDGHLIQPVRPKGPVKRTEYEGLWWGPEKIWIDDLVRLKPLRGEFSPQGNSRVLPPSSPGTSAAAEDRIASSSQTGGSQHRGLFLLVKSFQPANPLVAKSQIKSRMIVTGILFELAHIDSKEAQALGDLALKFGPATGTMSGFKNPLPVPPRGFVWRPILKKGYEIHAEAGTIAGRYYGRLMDHPLIDVAKKQPMEDLASYQASMLGFSPGHDNAINPKKWQRERGEVERNGIPEAQQEVEQFGRGASVVDDVKSEGIKSDVDEDIDMF
jgi:hypothetical protein